MGDASVLRLDETRRRRSVAAARAAASAHPLDPHPQVKRSFGFFADHRTIDALDPMTGMHSEIELVLLLRGRMRYSVGGTLVDMAPERLVAFWGGLPHRAVWLEPPVEYLTVVVPLAWILAWPTPNAFSQRLVRGEVFEEPDDSPQRREADRVLMATWEADVNGALAGLDESVATAVQARLHRLALTASTARVGGLTEAAGSAVVARASQYIVDNYRDPIRIDQIAAAVGVSERHLRDAFRASCDASVHAFVTSLRIAHAKRLLSGSDMNILDVAVESGFGSPTRFYESFRRSCGTSPRRYREQHPQT